MTSDTTTEMPKAYDPKSVEERLYRMWEERGYFKPAPDNGKEPFVVIMPPPNLTGELHLGHALMDTVEDILVRWHRMQGAPTLWLPGIDHAAIAVHVLIERELTKEGKTRFDIGKEAFLERVWEFVNKSRSRIFDQHKRLGASADWSRETFTMDPGPARAVRTVFYELYNRGLIYRGERMINWCPRCGTALSDLEVDHQEEDGFLWHVRYPLIDASGTETGQHITIATTRPETIVADTAIAVHPDDERYNAVVGTNARLPIIGRELIVVADEAIEKDFGSGALKVTPGHDLVDFEIGQRHNIPTVTAINLDGTMNDEAGPYSGMDRFAARDAIVRDLDAQGFLVKTEPYRHSVGHCDRCDAIVEPLISEQWFMAVNKEYQAGRSLAGEALQVVNDGLIEFLPPRFTKIYTNWMENLRDWCISRQLWWGHPIPAWRCGSCDQYTVPPPDVETPEKCDQCGSASLEQDPDTLDTWFSSGLWPVSTLGWPDDTEDLRRFYPTTVMETGYEIIFFWVARMIMMGLFCTTDRSEDAARRIPFKYVYLHGMVRDEHGAKMSKTKGNVVDPLKLADAFGTDALRFNLITAGATGQDQRLRDEKVEAARNFANKLWNAARFVVMQLGDEGQGSGVKGQGPVGDEGQGSRVKGQGPAGDEGQGPGVKGQGHAGDEGQGSGVKGQGHATPGKYAAASLNDRASLPVEDRWILSRLDRVTAEVDQLMHDFALNEAGHRLYDFLWNEYCDWYVELAKVRLREGQGSGVKGHGPATQQGADPRPVLVHVLEQGLRLLHPYMPYVTEELWQRLRAFMPEPGADMLIVAAFPQSDAAWRDEEAERDVEQLIDVVRAVRNIRSEKNVEPARTVDAYVVTGDGAALSAASAQVEALARATLHVVGDASEAPGDGVATAVLPHAQVVVPLAGLLDVGAERARLEKEIAEAEQYLSRIDVKLSNEQFRSRAPADVVAAEEERRDSTRTRLEGLQRALNELH